MTTSILITGGTVIDATGERRADVRVADGRVAEVADGLRPHAGEAAFGNHNAGTKP